MKRTFVLVTVFMFILAFSFTRSSYAIYQWVDEKGQVHITDYPNPSKRGQEKDEKESPVSQTEVTAPAGDEQGVQQQAGPVEKKEPVQPKPSPAVVQPLPDTQVKKPVEPAPQMPAQQSGKQVVPAVGQTVKPVPIAPMPPTRAVPQQAAPQSWMPSGMPSLPAFENGPSREMLLALLATFMTVILIVSAVLYLYNSLCLFLIAKKLDVPAAWLAWIPVLQAWAFFQSAGKSLWWILLFFIPFVNLIVGVYLWMCIAENLGKSKWLSLLTLVPIANLILPGYLAFSKK